MNISEEILKSKNIDVANELNLNDINKLLDPSRNEYEFHDKLILAQKYMTKCANCIYPHYLQVVDKDGLLKRFEEVYLTVKSIVKIFSPELSMRIMNIEESLSLSQNILRLGMLAKEELSKSYHLVDFLKPFEVKITSIKLTIPDKGSTKISNQLFLELKTALTRLAGLCGAAARIAKDWWLSNEDVLVIEDFYDPRKVSKGYLTVLVNNIIKSLADNESVPHQVRKQLTTEMNEVLSDLKKRKSSWNNVLSKLSQTMMVLAALITIGANVDEAYENAKEALNYISTQALSIPKISSKQEAKYTTNVILPPKNEDKNDLDEL